MIMIFWAPHILYRLHNYQMIKDDPGINFLDICLKELSKTTKNIELADVSDKIQTDASSQRVCYR